MSTGIFKRCAISGVSGCKSKPSFPLSVTDCARPLLTLAGGRADGAISADGRVAGCYLHGLFGTDAFRSAFLSGLGAASDLAYEARVDTALETLADHVERRLDLDTMLAIARAR